MRNHNLIDIMTTKTERQALHAKDLAERWVAFRVKAAPHLQPDGTYNFDSDDDDDEELRNELAMTLRALEYGFPKPEHCTNCNGEEPCDECMCGGCGGERWQCAGCS